MRIRRGDDGVGGRLGVGDGNGGVVGGMSWWDCAGMRMYVLDGLVLRG